MGLQENQLLSIYSHEKKKQNKTKTVHVCSMRLKLSNDPNSSLENSEQMINASCVDKAIRCHIQG